MDGRAWRTRGTRGSRFRRRFLALSLLIGLLYVCLAVWGSARLSEAPMPSVFASALAPRRRVLCVLADPRQVKLQAVVEWARFHRRIGFDRLLVHVTADAAQWLLPLAGLAEVVALDLGPAATSAAVARERMEHRCFNDWDRAEALAAAAGVNVFIAPCRWDSQQVHDPVTDKHVDVAYARTDTFYDAMQQVLEGLLLNPAAIAAQHMHGCSRNRHRMIAFPNRWPSAFRIDPQFPATKDHGLVGLQRTELRGVRLSERQIAEVVARLDEGMRRSNVTARPLHAAEAAMVRHRLLAGFADWTLFGQQVMASNLDYEAGNYGFCCVGRNKTKIAEWSGIR